MKPNILKFLTVLLFLLYSVSLADNAGKPDSVKTIQQQSKTRYLQVSSNPTSADIYVNRSGIDYSTSPDYISPDFIKVSPSDTTVRVTLFQKGYSDTTINVSLSQKDTSFLIVSLRQSFDDDLIEQQGRALAHRKRKSLGHKLIIASAVPFVASAVAAVATQKYIKDARKDRDAMQNSLIRNSDSYRETKDSFADNRSKAKKAKAIGGTTLGTGIVFLSAGLILSF